MIFRDLNTYFVRDNLFISICSVFLLFYFSLLVQIAIPSAYYLFSFFGTLSIYNFFRKSKPSLKFFRYQLPTFTFELILYSLIICILSFYLIDSVNKYLYCIPLLLAFAYKFPIFQNKSLRSFPFLKLIIISLVWILMAIIPFCSNDLDSSTIHKIIFVGITQFLFFIAICIPFDIFDRDKDEIKTIATVFGSRRAIYLSIVCLALYFALHLIETASYKEKLAHTTISIIGFCILIQYRKLKTKTLQYYLVDGLIILQTLIVFIFFKLLE